jgi:hypothetical protein
LRPWIKNGLRRVPARNNRRGDAYREGRRQVPACNGDRSAGGKLGGFYSFDRIQLGDPFWVIVY